MSEIEIRPRSMLDDDQRFMTKVIVEKPALLLVSQMGSGKTGGTLTALRELLDSFQVTRVLVVAPLRVANESWPSEIEAWVHTRCLSYAVCTGTEEQRRYALKKEAEITIINRENLQWLWNELKGKWPFDHIVIDESSMAAEGAKRTRKTKITKPDGTVVARPGGKITRFGVLSAARKHVSRITLLTGTPGDLEALWGQIYLLDQGKRLLEKKSKFLDKWFKQNKYSYEIEPFPHSQEEILNAVKDVMISIPDKKIVEDPRVVPVYVDLSEKELKEYNKFKKTLVSEVHDVEALTKGVLTMKLLQFANGSMYRSDKTIAEVHDVKLQQLKELIERAQGENILVIYSFKFDLMKIRAEFPYAVVLNESPAAVKDWNAGKIKILLAHPLSCAHGLNLQYGGHIIIWYGFTWSVELFQQTNKRLPRRGQKKRVIIYKIIARNTIDERVNFVLASGEADQNAIIEAVKAEVTSSVVNS